MPLTAPHALRRRASAPSVFTARRGRETTRVPDSPRRGGLAPTHGHLPASPGARAAHAAAGPALPPSPAGAGSPRAQSPHVWMLAPELCDAGVPIAAGHAYVDADGQLFDAGRCDHAALRRRVRGGPLCPSLAANALLAYLDVGVAPSAEAFCAAVAAQLICPLDGTVPADPVAASNGRTYGRAALLAALQRADAAPGEPPPSALAGLELTPGDAVPQACGALAALVARLGLAPRGREGDDAAAAAMEADPDMAALLAELDMPDSSLPGPDATPAPADDAYVADAPRRTVALTPHAAAHADLGLAGAITAVAAEGAHIALGRRDGTVQILEAASLLELSHWPAYGAGAGGVSQIAIDLGGVLTLADGTAAGAPDLMMWDVDGMLLARLVLSGDAPVTWIGTAELKQAYALTAAGCLTAWRIGRFAAATPDWQQELGPGGRASCNYERLIYVAGGSVWAQDCLQREWAPPRPGIVEVAPLNFDILVRLEGGEVAALRGLIGGVRAWGAGPRALRGEHAHALAGRGDTWAACIDRTQVSVALTAGAGPRVDVRLRVPPAAPRQRLIVGEGGGVDAATAAIDLDAPAAALSLAEDHLVALTSEGRVRIFDVSRTRARR